jgi:Holliday junction resolvase RusA-like endonuclease
VSDTIRLVVFGAAMPQGSKSGFIRGGKVVMVEGGPGANREAFKDWRSAVAAAGRDWQAEHGSVLLDEPLGLTAVFHLPKPSSAPKWKLWARGRPDVDKLARTVLDALTGVLWVDDSRVVSLHVQKPYAIDGPPRAEIVVEPLGAIERSSWTVNPVIVAERSA